jgi:ferredoxin--NADP+ reductase
MASPFGTETVLDVRHWTDAYFSFTTTRDDGFRFENGQFVMIGLEVEDGSRKPLMRAYSIASANWEEQLEFFSIKVQDGPLTSRLQHIQPGDDPDRAQAHRHPADQRPAPRPQPVPAGHRHRPGAVAVGDQGPGDLRTLRTRDPLPRRAPRRGPGLPRLFRKELPNHEFLGETIREKLLYYPAVSREPFTYNGRDHQGRITDHLDQGRIATALGLEDLDPARDRAMICGSPQMLADFRGILDRRGFTASPRIGTAGEYVFERAFVEK